MSGAVVVRDRTIAPGDSSFAGPEPGKAAKIRPGHAMIAAAEKLKVVHAVQEIGVCESSVGATAHLIVRVYRPANKECWA